MDGIRIWIYMEGKWKVKWKIHTLLTEDHDARGRD